MSNPIIIHISDLHITDHTGTFIEKKNISSCLTSDITDDNNFVFLDKFIKIVKNNTESDNIFLIITGDLTNMGEVNEFDAAKKYVKKIIDDLNIDKTKILIVPGDHDINRRKILNYLDSEKPDLSKEKIDEIKFENFQKFYNEVFETDFEYKKVFFNKLNISENLVLLGANSLFSINQLGGEGNIPITQFDSELSQEIVNSGNKNLIIAFHHNITGRYENILTGQWEKENRSNLFHELQKHKIKLVLYGNEHTPVSGKLDDIFYYSESGTLAMKQKDPQSFKIYEIISKENITTIKNNYFRLLPNSDLSVTKCGSWGIQPLPNDEFKELDEFIIIDNSSFPTKSSDLPENESNESKSDETFETEKKIYLGEFSEKLYDIVKRKKLFHSGHFHWSESSRAHNWIDVTKLLECKEDADTAKDSIIDVIETFKLNEECDLIVGIGYEGNIIASKPAIKYNINYSFLPYSYRYDGHNPVEKQINFTNEDCKFKTVMMITDVVNDGRTIKKLIESDENIEFFKNVEKIIVISLFYTGQTKKKDFNFDIMNAIKFNQEYKIGCSNNIEYYTVTKLRVEKCDYENVDDCFIYKHKLNCVHLFYDEKS